MFGRIKNGEITMERFAQLSGIDQVIVVLVSLAVLCCVGLVGIMFLSDYYRCPKCNYRWAQYQITYYDGGGIGGGGMKEQVNCSKCSSRHTRLYPYIGQGKHGKPGEWKCLQYQFR